MPKFDYQSFIKQVFSIMGNTKICFFIVRTDLVVCGTLSGKLFIWSGVMPGIYLFTHYGNNIEENLEKKLNLLTNAITHYNDFDLEKFVKEYEDYITNGSPEKVVKEMETYFQINNSFAIQEKS